MTSPNGRFPTRARTLAPVLAVACLSAVASLLAAGTALAAPGFTSLNVNMRAGPDLAYPVVTALPQGTPVEVFGCLSGWNWCDTAAGGARGWVAGPALQVLYDQEPEPLPAYGGTIGLPLIGFDFDSYWGTYYRDRPWFSRDDRWHGGGPYGPDRGPGPGPDRGPGPGPWRGGPMHADPDIGGGPGPNRAGPGTQRPNPGGPMQGGAGAGGMRFPGGQGGFHGQGPGAPGHPGGAQGPGGHGGQGGAPHGDPGHGGPGQGGPDHGGGPNNQHPD